LIGGDFAHKLQSNSKFQGVFTDEKTGQFDQRLLSTRLPTPILQDSAQINEFNALKSKILLSMRDRIDHG
jgi:hypothetical protein